MGESARHTVAADKAVADPTATDQALADRTAEHQGVAYDNSRLVGRWHLKRRII